MSVNRKKLNQLIRNFDGFITSISDWSKPLKQSAQIINDEKNQNFDQQGALYQGGGFIRVGGAFANNGPARTRGSAWAPLAESTQKQRRREGYPPSRPILIRSGKLKNSFRVFLLTPFKMTYGSRDEVALYHQYGTKKMPQRKILGLTNKSKTAIKLVFSKFIAGNLKRYFKLGR